MSLSNLPTEIFNKIVSLVLPEGFESLALTCQETHALCTPFLKCHNQLRSQYHRLALGPSSIKTLLDLILRIDSEPIIARYIIHADFGLDRYHSYVQDFYRRHHGPLKKLLADSPYLKKAGLDWKKYHDSIKADLRRNRFSKNYSQHVSAFVLTLLPNVKTLVLSPWQPLEAPKKLLEAIVAESKLSTFLCEDASLAQLTKIKISTYTRLRYDWWKDFPLLALPNLRSYRGPNFVARGDLSIARPSKSISDFRCGQKLETIYLKNCCINDVAIANLLKHAPHLRSFKYTHSPEKEGDGEVWNIFKFIAAIEGETGSYLEELSIKIGASTSTEDTSLKDRPMISAAPSEMFMRGFKCLRKLELPLEIAICDHATKSARISAKQGPKNFEIFINELLPASVSHLSLSSCGIDVDARGDILKAIGNHFITEQSRLPSTKEIQLLLPGDNSAIHLYKENHSEAPGEVEKVDVISKPTSCGFSLVYFLWWAS
ncbi:uncharacterized protein EAF01_008231 [Botrytis porri]|uniref:F-box domain-containing protein n=1 Tax=Botrytis porri TaxID=87229 RepID=A0A4Z1L722_9HELO|nr:uncharacterized protein EAF01_008231 [Botrytis porri]KAF7899018.1 hypothetical protein EAF01_008231 [Botrytis porri]TGO92537.1 hypothetical protein BPOR_0001g00220 [Botrytis porri]